MRSRREALKLGLLAGLGLSGCSAPTLQLVRNSFQAGGQRNRYGAPAGFVEQLPQATMGVEIPDGRFITVLANAEDSRLTWVSGDRKFFFTERGRLVATQGLDRDLLATRWLKQDPLLRLREPGFHLPPRVYRQVDLKAGKDLASNVSVESEFISLDRQTITVAGQARDTTRVYEIARVRNWFWETHQLFWVDRDQPIVWRSQQCYCPEVGLITLELLKKPAV